MKLNRFGVISDGLIEPAFVVIGNAAVVVGRGHLAGQAQWLVVIGDGLIEVAFSAIGHAAVVVGPGNLWVKLNGLL